MSVQFEICCRQRNDENTSEGVAKAKLFPRIIEAWLDTLSEMRVEL